MNVSLATRVIIIITLKPHVKDGGRQGAVTTNARVIYGPIVLFSSESTII